MSVFKKLHNVQKAMRSLAANAEGQTGAARYNYVSGAKLLGFLRPLMDKEGLLLTQEVADITNTPITYSTRQGEKTEMFTTLHIKFTWIDADDGTQLENSFYANGMNAWDKGLGSALTYGERYYLMKFFHIATDEDDIDALVKEEAITPTPDEKVAQSPVSRPVAGAYNPMSARQYSACVNAYVKGTRTKTGQDYRTAWIESTGAGPEQIAQFDKDAENIRNSQK